MVRELDGNAGGAGQTRDGRRHHEGALSRGRGFMGAAMVDDPAVVVFAGGISNGGDVVDSRVDAFSRVSVDATDDLKAGDAAGAGEGEIMVDRDVVS